MATAREKAPDPSQSKSFTDIIFYWGENYPVKTEHITVFGTNLRFK